MYLGILDKLNVFYLVYIVSKYFFFIKTEGSAFRIFWSIISKQNRAIMK